MAGPREWSPRETRFVLKTELSGDMSGWFPPEQECFVIDIDSRYAKVLLKRRAIFMSAKTSDKDLWEMYFWDASGEYYGVDWEETGDREDEQGRQVVVPDWEKPGRTEVDQAVIREEEVCWTALPKHGEVYVITETVNWDEIQQIANAKKTR